MACLFWQVNYRFKMWLQNEEILSSEALQGRHSAPYLLSVKHTRAVEGVTNFYLSDTLSPSHGQPATTTVMVNKAVVISVIVGVAAGMKYIQ